MIILGIDPGSTKIGYGLIKKEGNAVGLIDSGLLKIEAEGKNERLLDLEKSFSRLLRKTKPDLAVLEKLFFVKNVKTGLEVAQSRGVLTLLIIKHKIPLIEFTPLEVKQIVTGFGHADKKQILNVVLRILKIKKVEGGDDAADALACAIAGSNHPNYLNLKLKTISA